MNKPGHDFSQVPVYYFDQNRLFNKPAFIWTREQTRGANKKLGIFRDHGRTFQLFRSTPLSLRHFFYSDSEEAYASISLSEMRANVGITNNPAGEPAIPWLVRSAQEKIAAIGRRETGTYDDLAPLAFGSWRRSSSIEVSVQP